MAYEYAQDNIRVNAIAPGHIETPIYAGIDEHKARMAERIPMRRFGGPEEVASIAVLLATDEMSYVTGHTIVVDGGRLLA
ncbi:Glucose 1-dehydrogenase 2 [compost metagenome]